MDVFRFMNPDHPTLLDQGYLVNGLKTKMWIERYRDASEFEFTANVETMVHKTLPVGCLVSHVDTAEVMIVENHEIREEAGQDTEVKITGRSFETFLENRVVGANKAWPTDASATTEYTLAAGFTWDQAVQMLNDHMNYVYTIDLDDGLTHIEVVTDVSAVGDAVARSIQRGELYSRLIELLAVDDLGIKMIRPGVRSPLGLENLNLVFLIHKGDDLTKEIAFSHSTGEIENADYLWTNKKLKNAALVTGRWLETVVKDDSSGYDRRMMYVDGSDIDSSFSAAPTGEARTILLDIMAARGRAYLAAQNNIALVKSEPTKNSTIYRYREHYDLGDWVTVAGAYSETAPMQITEYVEIEDETGQVGYPTLSAI